MVLLLPLFLLHLLGGGAVWGLILPAADPAVRWVGRTVVQEDGSIVQDWPGTSASITLKNMSYLSCTIRDGTNGTRLLVTVEGPVGSPFRDQPIQMLLTQPGQVTYNLLSSIWIPRRGPIKEQGPLKVTLINTQEGPFMNTTDLHNLTYLYFETDGTVLPTAPRPHRLEFIGDSITAGFGSAAPAPCAAAIYNNDVTYTYAWLLCKALNAECFYQAVSGIGMYCSYPKDMDDVYGRCCGPPHTMPTAYGRTLIGGNDEGTDEQHPWDFERWTPEAVIINLGTNDLCCGRASNSTFQLHYLSTYITFIRTLSTHYPDGTPFFLAHGSMINTYAPLLEFIRAALLREGLRVYMLDVFLGSPYSVDEGPQQGGGGCDGHPSQHTHRLMFDKALPQVQSVLQWETNIIT